MGIEFAEPIGILVEVLSSRACLQYDIITTTFFSRQNMTL